MHALIQKPRTIARTVGNKLKMKTKILLIFTIFLYGCNEIKSSKSQKVSEDTTTVSESDSILNNDMNQQKAIASIIDDTLCSATLLRETFDKMDSLSSNDILLFVLTFDTICHYNVEYSEWSNELLFEIANKYPVKLLTQLDKRSLSSLDYILNEFSTPIHDGIYLDKTLEKIKNAVVPNNNVKSKVISALKKAIENETNNSI